MELIYAPEGQAEQRWPVDLGRLRVAECEAIERRTGMTYGVEFKERLLAGSTSARRALLWTLLRREHHTMPYADVDFADGELTLTFDLDELRAIREALDDEPTLTDDQRAAGAAALDAQIAALDAAAAAADDVDQVDEDDAGKAPRETLPNAIG